MKASSKASVKPLCPSGRLQQGSPPDYWVDLHGRPSVCPANLHYSRLSSNMCYLLQPKSMKSSWWGSRAGNCVKTRFDQAISCLYILAVHLAFNKNIVHLSDVEGFYLLWNVAKFEQQIGVFKGISFQFRHLDDKHSLMLKDFERIHIHVSFIT